MAHIIAADFLLEALNELRKSSRRDCTFTIEEMNQRQNLEEDIKCLIALLENTVKKLSRHPEGMKLLMEIREEVSDAANVVELFMVLVSEADRASDSLREHQNRLFLDLHSIGKAFKNLIAKVKLIYDEKEMQYSFTRTGGPCLSGGSNTSKVVKDKMVIGFDDEVRKLMAMLRKGGLLKIISIVGATGVGKTTLAREIYDHPLTLEHFEFRAWVAVSQDYNETMRRNLLIDILESAFAKNDEDYKKSSDDMLIEKLFNFLWGKKYLIVIDDMWSLEAWYDIQASLPVQCKGSKVVFTSRQPFRVKSYNENSFEYSAPSIETFAKERFLQFEERSDSPDMVEGDVLIMVEYEASEIMRMLRDSGEDGTLQFITIYCTRKEDGGSGGTTLARKVYNHPLTSESFEFRTFLLSEDGYGKLDLLIAILKSAFPQNYEDYEKSSEDMLVKKIFKFLLGKKYLIVIGKLGPDDKDIKFRLISCLISSLPRERNGSKVVLIKRHAHNILPQYGSFIHHLRPLSKSWSWELLQKKVFREKNCPQNLAEVCENIAQKCEGLPLAIVTIAETLATEAKTLNAWEEIAKNVSSIIAKKQEEKLVLSYNHLPLHLKVCFLHIGARPVGCEIAIRELIWLWIAEGFIQQNDKFKSLEDIAQSYLDSLIERNLIMGDRKSASTGRMKTCRIPDLLRELCLKKAKDDNFFVHFIGDDSFVLSTTKKYSHLFIFRQFFNEFFFSRPYPQNLRSFMCLGSGCSRVELYMSFFVENFKLLRILSFIPDECQGEILFGQLVHLRYLALQLSENADFRFPFHLVKLETLSVRTSCFKDIKLSCDILEMDKLRHLCCKQGMFTYHDSYDVEDEWTTLDSLQTLHRMCSCKQCLRLLKKTPNLRKLGLSRDPDTKGYYELMLSNLEFLKCLETLYVENTRVVGTPKLPWSLTKLTLCHTQLQWEELTIILKELRSLKYLKLLMDACRGPVWDTKELRGLAQLKYLRLKDLDIDDWHASVDQFQQLEVLVIQDCRKLNGIPIEFEALYKLCEIKVERSSRSVEDSARKIEAYGRARFRGCKDYKLEVKITS